MTDWLLWQLADSAFPSGGFAHSAGLEAAWQLGEVDAASLGTFVNDAVTQAAHGALPFVSAGHGNPGELPAIDLRCDAYLRNPIGNRASRMQGRAWLGACERAFQIPAVGALGDVARAASLPRHYAPLFGATLRLLDVDGDRARRLYLFGVCRGTLSAAVRLGIVGTNDAQRLLAETASHLERTIIRCSAMTIEDAAQSAPLADLWQSAHDRLYSRLFQS